MSSHSFYPRRSARLAAATSNEFPPKSSTNECDNNEEPPIKRQRKDGNNESPHSHVCVDSAPFKSATLKFNDGEASSAQSPSTLHDQVIYPSHHASIPFNPLPFSSFATGTLRIVSWNVCSFRAIMRSGAFLKYIDQERPHILCIQETKMSPETLVQFDGVSGYITHWHHSKRKGHYGVATLVREDVAKSAATDIRVSTEMGDHVADTEGRVLTLYLPSSICVVNAYVPNSGGKLARLTYRTEHFEPAMRKFLSQLSREYVVIYCGDLNVAYQPLDIHNSKGNQKSAGHTPQEREQFRILLSGAPQWVDCFRTLYPSYPGYTYYSKRFGTRLREQHKGWRLDYFLVDTSTYGNNAVLNCFVRAHVQGSDHYPLVMDLACDKVLRK